MNDISNLETLKGHWQHQVDAWKLSEQSQKKYCKDNNLSYHCFIYWRRKLEGGTGRESVKRTQSGFATVKVQSDIDRGLTLSLPNGFIVRGICADNLSLLRPLLAQL